MITTVNGWLLEDPAYRDDAFYVDDNHQMVRPPQPEGWESVIATHLLSNARIWWFPEFNFRSWYLIPIEVRFERRLISPPVDRAGALRVIWGAIGA